MREGWMGLPAVLVALLTSATECLPAQGASQTGQTMRRKLDEAVLRCLREDGTPSASVAIVEGGQITYVAAFGDAVIHPKRAAVESTRYQLASISKTFTAQAILMLEADGRLSLEDKVSQWFPCLSGAADVTLRELLNHTSGYPDHYPQSYPAGVRGKVADPDKIIDEWGRHPLLFPPGTRFHYSNLEYEIAGRIVEKVSGRPLFELMQERIFKPLHMDATIDLDTIPENSPAIATGYVQTAFAALQPAPYEGPGWSFGSGQVVTTARDLALWDAAFLERRVLPPRQAAEEIEPARLANGSTYPSALGLFVSHDQGADHFYHVGQGLGFEAVNLIYPGTSTAIVVLTNTNATPTCLKIADELTYLLLPPSADDQLARALFAGLKDGKVDQSLLSEDLKQYLTPGRLSDYKFSLEPLGPVQAFSMLRKQTTDGLTTSDYDIVAGGKKLRLHLLLLPNGKVEDVSVSDSR